MAHFQRHAIKSFRCWPQACLHIAPEKRLTCSELLKLPYLAGVEADVPATLLRAQVTYTFWSTAPADLIELQSVTALHLDMIDMTYS